LGLEITNPGEACLKEYFEASILERLDHIKFIGSENKVFQSLREHNQGTWQIVELCRELIWENAKLSEHLLEGIENDREAIKKLG
jgi:hypothetical protein